MIFANAYHELGLVAGDRGILDRSRELAERVMREHVKPDLQLVLEWVQPGGVPVATDAGQTFLPGHAIESMWFLERIFRHHGRSEWFGLNFEAMRWNLEKGWDREYGGLFLACHATGGPPHWPQPQSKVWWPHTEALYALLRAYEATGADWCADWYRRLHAYSFGKFPNREQGEWHQYLDRQGQPIPIFIKKLAVKDPFHLPRTLILAIQTLRRWVRENSGAGEKPQPAEP
jgi:N-acylglucosamine 2-epimerase